MTPCEDVEPPDPLEFTQEDLLKGMVALKEATELFYQTLGSDAEMPACAVIYGIDLDPKTGRRVRTIATIGSRPKEEVRWALEQEVQSGRAKAYIVVAEAWQLTVKTREHFDRLEGSIKDIPGRIEIFLLYGALPHLDIFKTWIVTREKGNVMLTPQFDGSTELTISSGPRAINMWKCVWPTKEAL